MFTYKDNFSIHVNTLRCSFHIVVYSLKSTLVHFVFVIICVYVGQEIFKYSKKKK